MDSGDRRLVDVGANKDCALFDSLLPAIGLGALESGLPQRPRNATGDVPGRLSQPGRERAVRDDWPDSRKHQRNCGKQVGTELA